MRQDTQGFTFVMFFLQTAQKLLALGIIPQEQGGGFGKSPLEVRIADFVAGSPQAFATRFLAAFDQAAIRGEVLHAWKAVDIVDFVEQHKAETLADARYGLEQLERMGIVLLGGVEDIEFEVLE